jgi:hypothetical protein
MANQGLYPVLAAAVLLSLLPAPGMAQMSEVPIPNSSGDFTTALILGNRGYYTNDKWLVVKPPNPVQSRDYGITCHDAPNGPVRSRIVPGAIMTAVFRGPANLPGYTGPNLASDAIVRVQGLSWLRVRGSQADLAYPDSGRRWDELGECYVRANVKQIAPITADALRSP